MTLWGNMASSWSLYPEEHRYKTSNNNEYDGCDNDDDIPVGDDVSVTALNIGYIDL